MLELFCPYCNRILRGTPGTYCFISHELSEHDDHDDACGHTVYLSDADGNIIDKHFRFTHPDAPPHYAWLAALLAEYWPGIPVRTDLCYVTPD